MRAAPAWVYGPGRFRGKRCELRTLGVVEKVEYRVHGLYQSENLVDARGLTLWKRR
jgi:hypothetical protein